MKNRLKHLRLKAGLTQRQLAEAARTSQQQIQRIETGQISARVDLANKLCTALKQPLDSIFPGAGKAILKWQNEVASSKSFSTETLAELGEHGVEGDIRVWYFLAQLRGHTKPICFRVPAAVKRDLFSRIQSERNADEDPHFIVFDSYYYRIAINLRDLVYSHFLFDSPIAFPDASDLDETTEHDVQVFLSNNNEPLEFSVEPDDVAKDDEEDEGAFRNIFWMLEMSIPAHVRTAFTDGDREFVFLRTGDIALLQVPLRIVESESLEEEDSEADLEGSGRETRKPRRPQQKANSVARKKSSTQVSRPRLRSAK